MQCVHSEITSTARVTLSSRPRQRGVRRLAFDMTGRVAGRPAMQKCVKEDQIRTKTRIEWPPRPYTFMYISMIPLITFVVNCIFFFQRGLLW